MRAGSLRDRVTLQRLSAGDDTEFGPQPVWSDVATFWASVVAEKADEPADGKGARSEITYLVRRRFTTDISEKDRLVYRGKTLDITGIIDTDGRRHELLITAVEHPTNG